jgi:hypothetical protein
LQASSGLIFDVLRQYGPRNLLLDQANREVFELQLEETRLAAALTELERRTLRLARVDSLTPLSFPIWADRLRSQILSTETYRERIQRMVERLEETDLMRLQTLIQVHDVTRVILLGDFLHGVGSQVPTHAGLFDRWRAAHAAIEFIVIAGNHDRLAARHELTGVQWEAQGLRLGPFVCRHHPP